jgi:hypothetical protein
VIPVETTPGIGRGDKGKWWRGVNSTMIYLIHCKNFCKCHNVLPPRTTIKKEEERKKKNRLHGHIKWQERLGHVVLLYA